MIIGNKTMPKVNCMLAQFFVDANNSGDTGTRRSQTGILLFYNNAPIIWSIKMQNPVETSIFRSEFTEMKNALDII